MASDTRGPTHIPLSYVLGLLRPHRLRIAAFLLVSLAASLFDGVSAGLLVPLLVELQPGFDAARLPQALAWLVGLFGGVPDGQRLLYSLAAVVTAVLLKNAILSAAAWLSAGLSRRVTVDLRRRGIALLMHVGQSFYGRARTGDLVERLLGHTSRIEYLLIQVADFIVNLTSFLALFALLIVLSWQLTLLTALATALIVLALSAFIRFIGRAGDRADRISRGLSAGVYESIGGIHVIRAFTQESRQQSRLCEQIEAYGRANQQIVFGNYMAHILTESLGIVALGLIFLVALRLGAGDQQRLLVQIVPFMYVLTRILPAAREMNRARAHIASRLPFAQQVYELLRLDDKPFVLNGEKPFAGLRDSFRLRAVSFTYPGETAPALDAVDLVIPARQTTAIVGASGAGKSTLVELLLRVYDPDKGTILVDGTPLPEFDLVAYRRRIGLVSQDVFLFHDTVAANIAFGVEGATESDVTDAARSAGADEFIRCLPDGYETVLGERGATLSGGQRQRIAIARAFLRDPDILILDEATSAVDPELELSIRTTLGQLYAGRTVVVIAHQRPALDSIDHLVVLDAGRVIASDAQEQVEAGADAVGEARDGR
jgi:ATP-binding cassette, subfamily B, bacterial MsbA